MIFVSKGQFTTAFLASLLVLCFGNIAQPAFAAPPASSATLAALADSFVDARFELNPLMGTMITGDVRYEDKFVNNLTPLNQFWSMPLTLVQLASTKGAQPF